MKLIRLSLILVVCFVPVFAQQQTSTPTVTDDDFQKLIVAVSNEDWDTAVSLSSKFIKQLNDDDKRLLRLRYIYLYAAAGKVTDGRMEFDQLEELAKDLVGYLQQCFLQRNKTLTFMSQKVVQEILSCCPPTRSFASAQDDG